MSIAVFVIASILFAVASATSDPRWVSMQCVQAFDIQNCNEFGDLVTLGNARSPSEAISLIRGAGARGICRVTGGIAQCLHRQLLDVSDTCSDVVIERGVTFGDIQNRVERAINIGTRICTEGLDTFQDFVDCAVTEEFLMGVGQKCHNINVCRRSDELLGCIMDSMDKHTTCSAYVKSEFRQVAIEIYEGFVAEYCELNYLKKYFF
jgi:hypothetical protein